MDFDETNINKLELWPIIDQTRTCYCKMRKVIAQYLKLLRKNEFVMNNTQDFPSMLNILKKSEDEDVTYYIWHKRFVDDIYRQRKRNEPDELCDKMNSYCPNIKFTIEISMQKFLDTKILKTPNHVQCFMYQKESKQYQKVIKNATIAMQCPLCKKNKLWLCQWNISNKAEVYQSWLSSQIHYFCNKCLYCWKRSLNDSTINIRWQKSRIFSVNIL